MENNSPKKNVGVAFKDLDEDWQKWTGDMFMDLMHLAAEQTNEWAIECIKHLAVINAAGLAGAATLAGLSKPFPHSDPVTAAKLFLAGLFTAFVCLFMGFHMNLRGMKRLRIRMDSFFGGTGTLADFGDLEPIRYRAAILAVAVISLAVFLMGVASMLPFDIGSLAQLLKMT
ncbi:hypothetical protein SB781_03280 [Paraburkholderia sp. SIMBA_061]